MKKIWSLLRRDKAVAGPDHRHEVFRHLPFPFPDDRFPEALGAVIQRTVLEGHQPAREVIHTADDSWLVGDGVTDPNAPGAAVAACMIHALEHNSSVVTLATLPLGKVARRDNPGMPWVIEDHEWEPELEAE